jgi:hypothetical protein
MKRCLRTICFATLMASGALAQQKKSVPPPPKPAEDGPSLEVTMKFIQDKMNDQGTVDYVLRSGGGKDAFTRSYVLISDVVADSSTCILRAKRKTTSQMEGTGQTPISFKGKRYNGHMEQVDESTTPFKVVDSITVESAQDAVNRQMADAAHPEITFAYTPAVFQLMLKGTKDAFSFHRVFKLGEEPPENSDRTDKQNTFLFRDEETANRVAKAMQHAVELCGGGNKPEPF